MIYDDSSGNIALQMSIPIGLFVAPCIAGLLLLLKILKAVKVSVLLQEAFFRAAETETEDLGREELLHMALEQQTMGTV